MATLEVFLVAATALGTGLISFAYNDGREHVLGPARVVTTVVGLVGVGVFVLAQVALRPPSPVDCDYVLVDDAVEVDCVSPAEMARRNGETATRTLLDSYVVGPLIDLTANLLGGVAGWGLAMATGRAPADGRRSRILFDDE